MENVTGLLVAGLTAGAIYALVGMSFNVIFAATGVLNFAQGELFMAGAVLSVLFTQTLGLPVLLALAITVVAVSAIALVEERLAVRPALRAGRGAMGWVLATLGFSIVTASVFALVLGPDTRQPPSFVSARPTSVLGVSVSAQQLLLVVVCLAVAAVLYVFYQRTSTGIAMRALAQDSEAAAIRGVPVSALGAVAFALSGAVAGLAGFMAAPVVGAYPSMGFTIALQGFIAAAIGGIPHIKGALIGGLALGVVEAFGSNWFGGGYRTAVTFLLLVLVLAIRPAGLFGRLTARAV